MGLKKPMICLDCRTEMLIITLDGDKVDGFLCFVCGKELN
jgi:hypothetical protein